MTNYTKKETDKYGNTYYYNDKDEYHRLDGPATEWADGSKFWWVDGKKLTEEQFKKHPRVIEKMLGKIIGEVLGE